MPELGAPHGAGWNGFLRQHKLQYWLAGRLARAIGLFPAANLLVLLAAVLAALSFHAVSRYFRARPEWAFAGACAFALSPFFFHRSLSHLTLSFYWPIPLAILVVTWAFGRRGIAPGSRRFWVAAAIVLVAGLHNIYYAALARPVPGAARASPSGSCAVAAARRSGRSRSLVGAVRGRAGGQRQPAAAARERGADARRCCAPTATWSATRSSRSSCCCRSARARSSRGARPEPRTCGRRWCAARWDRSIWASPASRRSWRSSWRRHARPSAVPRDPCPPRRWRCAWILAYSVVGGVNGLVGLTGFVWLRATSRYSIWILALVLLWGVLAISRTALARRRAASVLAATVAGALTLADQLPPRTQAGAIRELGRPRRVRRCLRPLARGGASRGRDAVPAPGRRLPRRAAHPRGLATTSTCAPTCTRRACASATARTRAARRTPGSAAWSRSSPRRWRTRSSAWASPGIVVNRKAYPDGAQELREALAAAGRLEAWESPDRDFLFVRLAPSPSPQPPDVVVPPADGSESS